MRDEKSCGPAAACAALSHSFFMLSYLCGNHLFEFFCRDVSVT